MEATDYRLFYNFTDEDFSCRYDGIPYVIRIKEKKILSEGLARHLAKHFINHQIVSRMNKPGLKYIPLSEEGLRKDIEAKCLPEDFNVNFEDNGEPIEEILAKAPKEEPQLPVETGKSDSFIHDKCNFEAKSKAGLSAHIRKCSNS